MEQTKTQKKEEVFALPYKDYVHFIGGEWVDSTSEERIEVLNPATEEIIGTIPAGTTDDVDQAVAAARKAHEMGQWRRMPVSDRARIVRKVGELMMQRRDEIAATETLDQGRSIRQSKGMIVPLAANAFNTTLLASTRVTLLPVVTPTLAKSLPACARLISSPT